MSGRNWLEMRAEEWAPGQASLFDVDEAPAPLTADGSLFPPVTCWWCGSSEREVREVAGGRHCCTDTAACLADPGAPKADSGRYDRANRAARRAGAR